MIYIGPALLQRFLSVLGELILRIECWPPPPTPDFLNKNFCLEPGLFLLRRTWSDKGSRCCFQDFHSLTKGNEVSLLRIYFSEPDSDGKSTDLGVGVAKRFSKCSTCTPVAPNHAWGNFFALTWAYLISSLWKEVTFGPTDIWDLHATKREVLVFEHESPLRRMSHSSLRGCFRCSILFSCLSCTITLRITEPNLSFRIFLVIPVLWSPSRYNSGLNWSR